ncbi:hypothetical protein TNCV_1852951 [Trichonephila clavipes]|nr:hypothetical protein TNCV_1852951 [Trichonephila clavipes]
MCSKGGIIARSSSLKDITTVRAQYSKSVINVITEKLYGRKGLYCASTDTNSQPRLLPIDFKPNHFQRILLNRHA